mgnify:CR=1 FL=1
MQDFPRTAFLYAVAFYLPPINGDFYSSFVFLRNIPDAITAKKPHTVNANAPRTMNRLFNESVPVCGRLTSSPDAAEPTPVAGSIEYTSRTLPSESVRVISYTSLFDVISAL